MPTTTDDNSRRVRKPLEDYFRRLEGNGRGNEGEGRVKWRISCFDSGTRYADFIEHKFFTIGGKLVLDVACAWGGHALAFAAQGAITYASDFNDHELAKLRAFARDYDLNLYPLLADCQALPFDDCSFDVIIALELIEHIPSVDSFAREVARLLRPGGICILSTPARLRSIYDKEPHFGLKGIAFLPLSWQRFIATKFFQRSYPYPIIRQYSRASDIIKPFAEVGLRGWPVLGRRLNSIASYNRYLQAIAERYLWNFVVVQSASFD